MAASEIVGTVGTSLLLLAFALNVIGRLRVSYLYTALNLVGAGMAAYASYLIDFLPFVILELVWCTTAGVKLYRLIEQGESPGISSKKHQ